MMNENLYYGWAYLKLKTLSLLGLNKPRDTNRVIREYTKSAMDNQTIQHPEIPNWGLVDGRIKETNWASCHDYYMRRLLPELKGMNSILDAGCGEGLAAIQTKQAYPSATVCGFDVTPNRVALARKEADKQHANITFYVGDITKIPAPSKSVDATYTRHVLEQCRNILPEALRELCRVTRKKIILIEPDYERGNYAQKAFMEYYDYLRGLPEQLNLLMMVGIIKDWKQEVLHTTSNPLNPASLTVIRL